MKQGIRILLALALGACSTSSVPTTDAPSSSARPTSVLVSSVAPLPDPLPPEPLLPTSAIEACLAEGGELFVAGTIDNNDTRDHGDILTFDVSSERQIAVSTTDGTLKFWSLDDFVGEVGLSTLSYGAEILANVDTMQFLGDDVVAGDSQGIVRQVSVDRVLTVLGGTAPGTAINAVTVGSRRVAYADETGRLVIRPLRGEEGEVIESEDLVMVNEMQLLGEYLFLATASGLQVRDAGDLALLVELPGVFTSLEVDALRIIAASNEDGVGAVTVFDHDLVPLHSSTGHAAVRDVALLGTLSAAIPVERFPTEEGSRMTLSQASGTYVASFRFDAQAQQLVAGPSGELLFVAMNGGLIHMLSCQPE